MVREKTFRPPQDLVDELGQQVPLSEVRQVYSELKKNETDADPSKMRWAYRILRQEGLLKACGGGEVNLPAFVDLQLGPQVYVGLVEKCCEEVADALINDGIPGAVAPFEDGTIVFFAQDSTHQGELSKAEFPVAIEDLDLVAIEESRTRTRSLAKSAGLESVSCSSYVVEPVPLGSIEFEDLFLLKANDPPPVNILKVDTSLGLVFGWAIVSTIDGVDYFDKQAEHIPDESMLEAATEFMLGDRTQGEMHIHDDEGIVKRGQIVFAWPMTSEIAESFGIDTNQTGLMIAAKPDDPETLEKFADGTYTGFSIGGRRIPEFTEEVEG